MPSGEVYPWSVLMPFSGGSPWAKTQSVIRYSATSNFMMRTYFYTLKPSLDMVKCNNATEKFKYRKFIFIF